MTTIDTNTPAAGADPDAPPEMRTYGLLAEFEDVDAVAAAAVRVRDAGYKRWEVYTPYPVHGLDEAMGHRPTILPWIVLGGGLTGLLGGLFLLWWTNATSYDVPYGVRGFDFIISGKPIFSLPANIPPVFETTILLAAFAAFFGMLIMNMLPRFYHPVLRSERFVRATQDRFFIGIEADDPVFEREGTAELLRGAGAAHVEELEEEAE